MARRTKFEPGGLYRYTYRPAAFAKPGETGTGIALVTGLRGGRIVWTWATPNGDSGFSRGLVTPNNEWERLA